MSDHPIMAHCDCHCHLHLVTLSFLPTSIVDIFCINILSRWPWASMEIR